MILNPGPKNEIKCIQLVNKKVKKIITNGGGN